MPQASGTDDEAAASGVRSWWQHPAIIGAAITVVGGLATAIIASASSGGGDGDPDQTPSVRGVEARLSSEVTQFSVACPHTFVFDGEISVSGGTGDVAYRFVHVDAVGGTEVKERVSSVSFAGAGTASVRHEWVPTIPQREVFRTAAIEVLSPVSMRSNDVTVSGVCDSTLPPGPPVPPPDVAPPSG